MNPSRAFRPPGSSPLGGPVDELDRPHGTWTAQYADGKRAAEVCFEHGDAVGTATQWTTGGTRIVETEVFADHQEIRAFDDQDRLIQCQHAVGPIPHGPIRRLYPSGSPLFESQYDMGLPHGPGRYCAPDGSVIDEGTFIYGVPDEPRLTIVSVLGGGGFRSLVSVAVLGLLIAMTIQNPRSILGLLALGLAIVIHEWGHFVVAKRCGLPVESFRVGVGPNLLSFIWRRTRYEWSVIPLVGWVKVPVMFKHQWEGWRRYRQTGEVPEVRHFSAAELDAIDPPRPASDYLPTGRRLLFFSGGIIANLLTVFIALWLTTEPTRPDRAAISMGQMVGRVPAVVPRAIAEQAKPEHYTSDRPGLLRAIRDDPNAGTLIKPLVIISVFMAVFNLLPVPPLDGYRIVEAIYERIVGRPPPARIRNVLQAVGLLALATLMLSGLFFLGRDMIQMLRGQ